MTRREFPLLISPIPPSLPSQPAWPPTARHTKRRTRTGHLMIRCAHIHRAAKKVSRVRLQLEALTALLERENRIKEGAEKFLKLAITVRTGHVSHRIALKLIP